MSASHSLTIADGECTLTLTGEIDMANAEEVYGWLRAAVDGCGCPAMRIDLSRLDFVDSSGIRRLVEIHRYGASRGVAVTVRDPRPIVRRVLEVTGVHAVLGL